MHSLRFWFIALAVGSLAACASAAKNDDTGAAGSSHKDSSVDETPDADAPDDASVTDPNPADSGAAVAGSTDAGKADGGNTDAGKNDGGTNDAGTPVPKPAPPSGPVEGNPPAELIRPAPVIATVAAGSCTLAFATPWYFHASPFKDAAGAYLPIYAQLRGKPLSGNQPLPMVQEKIGPVLTQDIATETFIFTVPATNAEAMAGNHDLTLHGYDSLAATTQADGTDTHDYSVWYDSLMNSRCTPQADLKFLRCDSWDEVAKTWTPLDANNCRLAVTLVQTADGCRFDPHGNMGNFGPDAAIVGGTSPFLKKCE